jgi:hypothetical protein
VNYWIYAVGYSGPVAIYLTETSDTVTQINASTPLAGNTEYCFDIEAVPNNGTNLQASTPCNCCGQTWPETSCTGADVSTINQGPDLNGNIQYELKAKITSQDGNSTTLDAGPWWAFGINGPNYYDCNGNFQLGEYDEGNEYFDEQGVSQISGYDGFAWWLDEWVISFEGCDPEDPNPDGVEEIGTDYPYPSNVYYVPCP